MTQLILSNLISLDGYYDGPGEGLGRIDWFRAGDEWMEYSAEVLDSAGGLLFGRRTYEGMASYWPGQTDPVGERMNAIRKTVVSRTLRSADWNNSEIAGPDLAAETDRLKREARGDIYIFGSGTLAASLMQLNLIDLYLISINPVVLGTGAPLFRPGMARMELDLIGTRTFDDGLVQMQMKPRPTNS